MAVCRAAFVALLALYPSTVSVAQGSPAASSPDRITNWIAPPYWMPALVTQKDAIALSDIASPAVEAGISPEAIQAVPTSPLAFTGISPCRLADTRGNGFSGQFGPPQITPAGRPITVANFCGIPATAQAVSFNFSAVNIPGAGFLVAYPAGAPFPSSATMTYNENTPNLSNAAVVPLGTGGAITVVAGAVSVDLVIDVNGYYAPQTVVNTINGLSGAISLAAGSNVTVTPSGNTLTIASTAGSSSWSLTGNSVGPANFLGTTNDQTLEFRVNNDRVLRLVPHPTSPNVIGGRFNSVTAGAFGASIGGGGSSLASNRVTDAYGTVAGGQNNQAGDNAGTTSDKGWATVGGGDTNIATGLRATVGGGYQNGATGNYTVIAGGASHLAQGLYTTIARGLNNATSGDSASIGGGNGNIATGDSSTGPGGYDNLASGAYSFAAGREANANHSGVFVWNHGTGGAISSTGINQFIVRSGGGMWFGGAGAPSFDPSVDFLRTSTGAHLTVGGVWTNNSDQAAKDRFEPVDGRDVLSRISRLPISKWSYKVENGSVRHIGPMAQDFAAAFRLGGDDRSIGTVDADGVAFAAIQALDEIVQEKESRIRALEQRLLALERRLAATDETVAIEGATAPR